ncbi:MAG TPA: transketolase family protein [Clostridiales bacterium]|jgi:transketolase|nr:transketolase family protein [Clostridiales bacterium]
MSDKIATRQAYGETLAKLGATHPEIVVLDGDLSGSTMTKLFAKAYPERFFNMGIAEQNLYGTAAGLALSGKTVFASTFAMFASGRAYEIVRNSIAYTGANVKICATHAGLTVGEDGGSHQCIEDIALMRVIPGMTVVSPADAVSARVLTEKIAELKGPVYFRLGRSAVPVLYPDDATFEIGKAVELRPGNDGAIIATGVMVAEAVAAADRLKEEGLQLRVLDMHTIKPLDEKAILKAASETGGIVTVEEHSVIGGLGGAVAELVVRKQPVPMAMIGVNDVFGQSGKPSELLVAHGLTADHIMEAARRLKQK